MENRATGEIASFDTEKLEELTKIADNNEEEPINIEQAFLTVLPRWQHGEQRCIDAKEKELQCWDEFNTYEEVADEGQNTLGLVWVLVEKLINGKPGVKARLAVRGDQEVVQDIRTDSPTVNKVNIKLFFLIAAAKGWNIKTCDVKSAFLQGTPLDRDVFVRPPVERRIKGVIWKMNKRAYGFCDASRGFYLELSKTLIQLGCKQSKYDPALYFWEDKNGCLGGQVLTHVDDLLHGSGTEEFEERIMKPLKKKFVFGSEEETVFRYVGMGVEQKEGAIIVNQDHYLETIEVPEMEKYSDAKDLLSEKDQESFRGVVGKVGWLSNLSRPDVSFDTVVLSSKLGKATIMQSKC